MIRLLHFVAMCSGLAIALSLAGLAGFAAANELQEPSGGAPQAAEDVPRVVMVLWRGETEVERGFRAYLAEHSMELEIEVVDLARDLTRLPQILAELRARPPALVYTWGTGITLGLAGPWDAPEPEQFLQGIPVVFTMVAAPLETRVVAPPDQAAREWVTGVSHIASLTAQINAIRSYLPLSRLGIVFNPQEQNSLSNVAALQRISEQFDFTLLEAPVPVGKDGLPSPEAIPQLVESLAQQGAEVLYIGPDNFIGNHRDRLTSAGIAHKIPSFSATELEIRDGEAMFGLVSRYELVGRLTAAKVREILFARRPVRDVPAETLERFTYLIRWPIAQQLRLYPPLPLLRYAEIIQ